MKRVTGLGGAFFKSEEPKKLREWYGKHLGLDMEDLGSTFFRIDPKNPEAKEQGRIIWSAFEKDTTYFDPGTKPFMFDYRVENLEELLKVLREEGVTVIDKVEELPYGKLCLEGIKLNYGNQAKEQ